MIIYGAFYNDYMTVSKYKKFLRKERTYANNNVKYCRKWYINNPTENNKSMLINAYNLYAKVYTCCKEINV